MGQISKESVQHQFYGFARLIGLPNTADMADVILHYVLNIIVRIEWHGWIELTMNQIHRLNRGWSIVLLLLLWLVHGDELLLLLTALIILITDTLLLNRWIDLHLLLIGRHVDIRVVTGWIVRILLWCRRRCLITSIRHRSRTIVEVRRRKEEAVRRVRGMNGWCIEQIRSFRVKGRWLNITPSLRRYWRNRSGHDRTACLTEQRNERVQNDRNSQPIPKNWLRFRYTFQGSTAIERLNNDIVRFPPEDTTNPFHLPSGWADSPMVTTVD